MFNISFDFDAETKKVSNIKCEEIKTKESLLQGSFVTVLDSKLELTKDAIALLGAKPGDRIAVNYWTSDNENTFPVIGKADAFTDDTNGNKLTKSGTVSFRGDQRKMLLEYGSTFKVISFKEKMFMLEPYTSDEQIESETKAVAQAKASLDSFVESIKFDFKTEESSQTDDLPF